MIRKKGIALLLTTGVVVSCLVGCAAHGGNTSSTDVNKTEPDTENISALPTEEKEDMPSPNGVIIPPSEEDEGELPTADIEAGEGNTDESAAESETPEKPPVDESTATEDAEEVEVKPVINKDFNFNTAMESAVKRAAGDENYIFSPLSLKAALALAEVGAKGETKAQILSVLGFETEEALFSWYNSVVKVGNNFYAAKERVHSLAAREAEYNPSAAGAGDDMDFRIVNGVWSNETKLGRFRDSYVSDVSEKFKATADSVPAQDLTQAVNDWARNTTNGLIPSIADDLSEVSAILANALYLRTAWQNTFDDYNTFEDSFTTKNGSTVTKEFMHQQDKFALYEKSDSDKLLVMPLEGGMSFVAVLGDVGDVQTAMENATRRPVKVKMPKLDIDSTITSKTIIDFLKKAGMNDAFSRGVADFSAMAMDSRWYVGDIIQKARIKTDEQGLEAAAVTAVMMTTTALAEPEREAEFFADRAFQFYIFADETGELLFAGGVQK